MRALFDDPRFDECLIKAGKMTMEGGIRPNHLILICLPFYRGEILEHNPSVVSNSILVHLFFFLDEDADQVLFVTRNSESEELISWKRPVSKIPSETVCAK